MAESRSLTLADPQATAGEGRKLAAALRAAGVSQAIVYLEGDLGAGKTTLARGFLEGLGHAGRVPSPTYTLVEPYEVAGHRVYHIDLYRIRAPQELDDLGLAEQLDGGAVALIEWPDHGVGHLPPPDLRGRLSMVGQSRAIAWEALTASGRRLLASMVPLNPTVPDA